MFSWYKYLIVSLVFSHLGFWSGSLFLIAPFPDLCLLVLFFLTIFCECTARLCLTWSESQIVDVLMHRLTCNARSNNGLGTCWLASSRFLTRAPANSLSLSVINVNAKPFSPVRERKHYFTSKFEPPHEKTGYLPMQKHRCRSAVQ